MSREKGWGWDLAVEGKAGLFVSCKITRPWCKFKVVVESPSSSLAGSFTLSADLRKKAVYLALGWRTPLTVEYEEVLLDPRVTLQRFW